MHKYLISILIALLAALFTPAPTFAAVDFSSSGLSFESNTGAYDSGQDLLAPREAFQYQLEHLDNGDIVVHWQVTPGYYLYREQLNVEPGSFEVPTGNIIEDEFFGISEVYKENFSMRVTSGGQPFTLTWQGCAEAGLCYPPMTDQIEPQSSIAASGSDTSQVVAEDLSISEQLASAPLLWTLAGFFLMGLLLTFTPCVLPMMPIISSIVVGSGVKGKRAFVLSLAYVVPMALTYAALGVIAASAGANIQAMMQSPWVLSVFSAFFVIFALAMFGAFELQLPSFLRQRLDALSQRQRGGYVRGAAVLGVLSAILVGPCMTAPLAGALLYIGQTGDAISGGLALFSLGLGMGVPLLVVGTLGAQLLPKPGMWMNRVKALFGFILLGTAIWFAERIVALPLAQILWASLGLAIWVTLFLSTSRLWLKVSSLVVAVWAVLAMVVIAINGLTNLPSSADSSITNTQAYKPLESVEQLDQYIAQAQQENRYIFIDFYADWCVSCIAMERNVFSRADVQQALQPMLRLKPDVTANSQADRELMAHLGVIGPPTMIFIGPDGEELRQHRIVGEVNAQDFLQTLSLVSERSQLTTR